LKTSLDEYVKLKRSIVTDGGFSACGRSVDLVDDFMYLGVCVWWKWDWSMAWKSAQRRARSMLYFIRQAGFQNHDTALAYQLRFASSQVLSHLDYVSALSGVEGNSVYIRENECIVADVLRTVTCLPPSFSGEVLQAESGTWDQATRIRMLQLRLFCKLTLMDTESTHFRALCLSKLRSEASRKSGQSCMWNWYDKVILSASKFSADPSVTQDTLRLDIQSKMLLPIDALAKLQFFDIGLQQWRLLQQFLVPDVEAARANLQYVSTSTSAFGIDYVRGERVFSWPLPSGTSLPRAITTWSQQLQEAVFASLRCRGNSVRQAHFRQKVFSKWSCADSGQRDLAVIKSASYLEPYWFVPDARIGRRMLRARVGAWGNEYNYRRQPHTRPKLHRLTEVAIQSASASAHISRAALREGRIFHILAPQERACYLCPLELWLPESMYHLILECQHQCMRDSRARVQSELVAIAVDANTVNGAPLSPDFDDPDVLYALLMLCTGVGSVDHLVYAQPDVNANQYSLDVLVPADDRSREALLNQRRSRHRLQLSVARMRPAIQWLSHFAWSWTRAIATQRTDEKASIIGRRLITMLCKHQQLFYSMRRRALRGNVGFAIRDRDPPKVAQAPDDDAASA
jgi:hypothetical protein